MRRLERRYVTVTYHGTCAVCGDLVTHESIRPGCPSCREQLARLEARAPEMAAPEDTYGHQHAFIALHEACECGGYAATLDFDPECEGCQEGMRVSAAKGNPMCPEDGCTVIVPLPNGEPPTRYLRWEVRGENDEA